MPVVAESPGWLACSLHCRSQAHCATIGASSALGPLASPGAAGELPRAGGRGRAAAVLATRATEDQYAAVAALIEKAEYRPLARAIVLKREQTP